MKKYDLIVIGAGPAGMTSALYASRADLSVLLLDRGVYGGQMNNTSAIENYPGFESILGPDLSKKMYKSATKFDAEYAYGTVQSVDNNGKIKIVHTDNGDFETGAIIIATGSKNKELGVPGEKEYSGRGVSYCAVCDGAFFKNKRVVVVGGGDSAIQESIYLSQLASEVIVIHRRDQLRAQKILQEQAFKNDKIKFVWNSNVKEILGDQMKVTGVKVLNNKTNQEHVIDASGVFIYVGNLPMTEQFKDLSITDEKGWIKANDQMETKIPGIFAAGDVREKQLRQIVTSTGDGGIAGQNAFSYLQTLK
ncbi:thioredoxin reductase [Philodulcilactobacillus myokoensis]|uniref:Thioredoxin reductase n=1 Tax=Philodulcilactobacillus myokoensis TaxID=2929573 RepID=A0A9W6ESJ9_9LACO|nr:thioredoxin-disulfide reductase [Philodulcilactobacillus myokoensis]GLB47136.1 thioredoxin reductase [Philodulcilactobacillus myokoensis]